MRVWAVQVWPELRKHAPTTPLTAFARSASSRMMAADLPPSSSATRLTVAAATWETRRPAPVEPVKETMSVSGCATMGSPTTGPNPVTMLKTPGAKPASSMISARMKAESGATSLGFRTTVQPAARAGATFAPTWLRGKFHGVMQTATPIASRTTRVLPMVFSKSNEDRELGGLLELQRRVAGLDDFRQLERHADLAGHGLGDFVGAPDDAFVDLGQELCAVLPGSRAPAWEGGARRQHRRLGILGGGRRDAPHHLFAGGVEDIDRLGAARRHPLAVHIDFVVVTHVAPLSVMDSPVGDTASARRCHAGPFRSSPGMAIQVGLDLGIDLLGVDIGAVWPAS